jgi:hypothetical protein
MNDLIQSKKYRIAHEYEVVFLNRSHGPEVIIGDFYGDPSCAVISPCETWCAIGGTGLIIDFVREPFEPYCYDHLTDQWVEFGRDKDDLWWIESLTAVSGAELVFTTDTNGNRPGTYSFDIATGEVKKQ